MSAYLFLFVAEGLSMVLERAVHLQELPELKICQRVPGISHLLFTACCFLEANTSQAGVIKSPLGIFEIGLGQIINPSIFSVLFSNSCPEETQTNLKSVLELDHNTFKERFSKRLTIWSESSYPWWPRKHW
jgi:hypothetical protein